ncbi:permease of the major facilitator superfamily [Moesziomyces antarcticus T-34]|uniref:Permease of the major facilitator superfamily n=1 Tax=Pseudozyma antarctica (strain T-34) TaxID=1151754 RepID=M9M7P8_PSEA3|nr:permease of the major facilitator superfamily [Moesziomyces antarcticus T-34]
MSVPAQERDRSGSLHSDEKEAIGYPIQNNTLTKDTGISAHDAEANSAFEDINSGFDEAEVKRVRRKVDRRLLPILGALYSIALIDRTNLSAARIAGAGVELKLTAGTNYSVPLLMFFVPYILLEMPSNLLLRKIGAAKQLSFIAFCWGVVMIGQGFVHSWQMLTLTRALIGAFEAGFFPACVWLISTWYVRRESQVRMSAFYLISVGISGFSNIIAYGMSLIKVSDRTFRGWRWIFIIEGLLTVVLAFVAYFLILDFPDKAAEKGFLTIQERDMILTRIERDRGDSKPDALTWAKAGKYALDIKCWLYGLMFMCTTMPTYAFAYFLPVILRGLGYSVKDAFLLGAAPYVVAMVGAFGTAVIADRFFVRMPILICQCLLTIAGLGMLFATKQRNVQLAGCFLGVWGANSNIPFVLNFSQNNVAGQSKKSFVSVIVIMFGGIGGIFASLAYNEKDAPLYRKGLYATLACQAFNVLCGIGFTLYFYSANKKIRAGRKVVDDRPGFTYTI